MQVAREVARAVRFSTGGLRHVKALALEVEGQAQVSMNLVDLDGTPLHRAFEMVRMEAEALGVSPTWSEIVGLVPERALYETAPRATCSSAASRQAWCSIVACVKRSPVERPWRDSLPAVASPTPAPGGGSVAAHVGALGAALAQMVAGLTVGRKKYAAVDAEMKELGLKAAGLVHELQKLVERDALAYGEVTTAYKLPKEPRQQNALRTKAIDDALVHAAQVPLETARACAAVAALAATAAEHGNTNAASDAGVAALLAEAACRGAVYNVRINVSSMTDKSRGIADRRGSRPVLREAGKHAAAATAVSRKASASEEPFNHEAHEGHEGSALSSSTSRSSW
jgi:glutamate formiminotransferase/formiminotetrahydrofolate cyclodeaminase